MSKSFYVSVVMELCKSLPVTMLVIMWCVKAIFIRFSAELDQNILLSLCEGHYALAVYSKKDMKGELQVTYCQDLLKEDHNG